MSSLRSYLPIAWAVTRFPIADSRSRRERPEAALASLSLCPITILSPFASVYKYTKNSHICKLKFCPWLGRRRWDQSQLPGAPKRAGNRELTDELLRPISTRDRELQRHGRNAGGHCRSHSADADRLPGCHRALR